MNHPKHQPETLWEGTHLNLVRHDRWESVQRRGTTGVVAIAAVTRDRKMILVEQFRPPVQQRVIEIPAGLAGDRPGQNDESPQAAAERELREETGYRAGKWQEVCRGLTSAGLTNEFVTLYLATHLERVEPGGGDSTEAIQVHEVALDQVPKWLAGKQRAGCGVDIKLYSALFFAFDPRITID